MSGEEKHKKTGKRVLRLALSLVSVAVLAYIAVMIITGRRPAVLDSLGLFPAQESAAAVNEYNFDVGRSRVFAAFGDSVAAAGSLGIQVLDKGGNELLRESFRMETPAVAAVGERAVAFDVGGTAVRVFGAEDVTSSLTVEGKIISASINRSGWFAVCAQEDGVSKGTVTVYDSEGGDVYRVNLFSGFVLSAELSPDNRELAVLNLTDNGSRVTYYSMDSEEPQRVFDLTAGLIIDIRYLNNADILAVTAGSLLVLNANNESAELYAFGGKSLGCIAYGGGMTAVYLPDYSVGVSGRLVVVKDDGQVSGEIVVDKEIVSMSLGEDFLAVLRSDRPVLYDAALVELPVSEGTVFAAGLTSVLALGGGTALAAGDNSAALLRSSAALNE